MLSIDRRARSALSPGYFSLERSEKVCALRTTVAPIDVNRHRERYRRDTFHPATNSLAPLEDPIPEVTLQTPNRLLPSDRCPISHRAMTQTQCGQHRATKQDLYSPAKLQMLVVTSVLARNRAAICHRH